MKFYGGVLEGGYISQVIKFWFPSRSQSCFYGDLCYLSAFSSGEKYHMFSNHKISSCPMVNKTKRNCTEKSVPLETFYTTSVFYNIDNQLHVNISQSMLLIKMLQKAKFVLHEGVDPGVLYGHDKNGQQIKFAVSDYTIE